MKTLITLLIFTILTFKSLGAVLSFIYTGSEINNTIEGEGLITYPDGLMVINSSDVSSFSLSNLLTIRNASGLPLESIRWNYSLADLTIFNASVVSGTVASFQMQTSFIRETTGSLGIKPARFIVDSFPNARTEALDGTFFFPVTEGTVALVPEPSALSFSIFAFLALLFRKNR